MDQVKDTGGSAGIGLAVGVAPGLIFGIMLDQIGLCIALGAAFGLVSGSVVDRSKKSIVPNR